MSKSISYRPEIDGLRAVAVIPVILFHLGLSWLPGGFVGVDVFFVISGFLITSIIIKDHESGAFSFLQFWRRRIRRIVPALAVMLGVTSLLGYFVLYAPDIPGLGTQGLGAMFSFANIQIWRLAGNYWGVQAENSIFLHTWSLSVEEQYYLLFPFLMIAALVFFKRHAVRIIAAVTILSAALFVFGCFRYPDATFYLLPTRAWELGTGALLATAGGMPFRFLRENRLVPLTGLAAILLSCLFLKGENGVSPWLMAPVAGAVLILGAPSEAGGPVRNMLASRPLVYVGKMSYSLYLWHWPLIVLAKNLYSNGKNWFSPVGVSVAIVAAGWLSWRFVEGTTRHRQVLFRPLAVFCGILVVFFAGLSKVRRQEDVSAFSPTIWNGQLYNVAPAAAWRSHASSGLLSYGLSVHSRPVSDPDVYSTGGIIKLYGASTPEVVVLGDSHAVMWSGVLDEIFQELKISAAFNGSDGTPVFFKVPAQPDKSYTYYTKEEKLEFDRSRIRFLEQWKPRLVIISARWSNELKNIPGGGELLNFLSGIGSKVLFLGEPPALFFGTRNAPQYLAHMELQPVPAISRRIPPANDVNHRKAAGLLEVLAGEKPDRRVLPLADLYESAEGVWVLDGRNVLYIDDNHLSQHGALQAKARIRNAVAGYFPGL